MGTRDKAAVTDFSGIPLEEEEEAALKDAAVISMGTEISEEDRINILALCDQVIDLSEYRCARPHLFCTMFPRGFERMGNWQRRELATSPSTGAPAAPHVFRAIFPRGWSCGELANGVALTRSRAPTAHASDA